MSNVSVRDMTSKDMDAFMFGWTVEDYARYQVLMRGWMKRRVNGLTHGGVVMFKDLKMPALTFKGAKVLGFACDCLMVEDRKDVARFVKTDEWDMGVLEIILMLGRALDLDCEEHEGYADYIDGLPTGFDEENVDDY